MYRSKLAGLGTATVSTATLTLVLLLGTGILGCAPAEEADPAAEQAAAWEALEQKQQALEAKRTAIAEKRAELAALETTEPAATETDPAAETSAGAAPTAEQLQAEIAELEAERDALQQEFGAALAEWINNAGIVEGAALTPEQRQAFDWKGHEDVLLAREYIERGGDYQRAIDIYQQALLFDPENTELKEALADAEEKRYPRQENFDQVKKGMTQAQVREILGPVNLRNVQKYSENTVEAWFYRKEDGGAAGVYFREKKKGEGNWEVYAMNWEVPRGGGEAEPG